MEHYDESDEWLDELLAFLVSLPPPMVTVVNPPKYRSMMNSAQRLEKLLEQNFMEGLVRCCVDKNHLLGMVTVEMIDLSVTTVPLLLETIAEADAVEVYPLNNGNIRFDITFQGVLKEVF